MARRASVSTASERRQRKIIGLLTGCGAVIVLAVIVVVVVFARVTAPAELPPELRARIAAETASGTTAAGSATAAPASDPAVPASVPPLQQQVERIKQEAAAGRQAPAVVYIRDADLNSWIASAMGSGSPVRSASAYFTDGHLYIVGTVNYRNRDWNVVARSRPEVAQGGIRFILEEATLGNFPVPHNMLERLQGDIDRNSSRFAPESTGLYVETIEIKPGVAVLRGHTAPRR